MTALVESVQGSDRYDLVIAACGYERRSRQLTDMSISCNLKFAVGYGTNETLSFASNRMTFEKHGYKFVALEDASYRTWLRDQLSDASRRRVLIDISCLTRTRLAVTVEVVTESPLAAVDFFYSLAAFSKPCLTEPQNEYLGPVSEYFSGWAGEYGKPIAVVSGLGYEYTRALGLIEFLDPTDIWLFFPESPIAAYDEAVSDANAILIEDVEGSRLVRYEVMDATSLVRDLSSLVAALRTTHRVVILPLGPKVFALSALLVGTAFRDVAVWRASAGKFAEPSDKESSEINTIFRVSLQHAEAHSTNSPIVWRNFD